MVSRKPNPYLIDYETMPLTDEEIKKLRPAKEVFAELGIPMPKGRPRVESPKRQVTLRLDEDVLEHFKRGGKGWQTRINETLAAAIKSK
jgi:uncharacterized protein (DUF4415 family)